MLVNEKARLIFDSNVPLSQLSRQITPPKKKFVSKPFAIKWRVDKNSPTKNGHAPIKIIKSAKVTKFNMKNTYHQLSNQERAVNLSILLTSEPGEFPRVESN
jgi:hypothetical protein